MLRMNGNMEPRAAARCARATGSVRPGAASRAALGVLALTAGVGLTGLGAASNDDAAKAPGSSSASSVPSLDNTRDVMGKWIDMQQIIAKERKDWQEGREILQSRLELVQREISMLEEKIKQSEASVAETDRSRAELLAQDEQFKAVGTQLAEAVSHMEGDVRRLCKRLPEPIQTKLQPLFQRIPEDAAKTTVTSPERYQNVLGILNEVNKSNSEITVNYEVHTLAGGKPSEVQAIYVGLAQAYYVSSGGEAGIGRPGDQGWEWEPAAKIAPDVLMALEIIQGKQTPAFVPLPVKIK